MKIAESTPFKIANSTRFEIATTTRVQKRGNIPAICRYSRKRPRFGITRFWRSVSGWFLQRSIALTMNFHLVQVALVGVRWLHMRRLHRGEICRSRKHLPRSSAKRGTIPASSALARRAPASAQNELKFSLQRNIGKYRIQPAIRQYQCLSASSDFTVPDIVFRTQHP